NNTNIYTKNDFSRITRRNMSSTTHGFRHEVDRRSSLLEVEKSFTIRTGHRIERTNEFNLPQAPETMNLLGYELESANVLDNQGTGDFEVCASGNVQMNAKGGLEAMSGNNLRLASSQNIEFDSRGRLSLDARRNIDIASSQHVSLHSAKTIRLSTGEASIEIDSTGKIMIHGNAIFIAATGEVTVNGKKISLN